MKACLYYCREKNFENEQWWQQVFKEQYLDLGCWPSFGAPASTPQQQESKLLSLLSSEPRSTCGVGSGVSQCGCATPESTFRRLRCTQRGSQPCFWANTGTSASALFMLPTRLSAQRNIPVSGQRCSPAAYAGRRLLILASHLCTSR